MTQIRDKEKRHNHLMLGYEWIDLPQERELKLINEDKPFKYTGATYRIHNLLKRFVNKDTGYSFPNQKYIANHLGMDEKTVKRSIAEMKRAGLITVTKKGRKNFYTVIPLNQTLIDLDAVLADLDDELEVKLLAGYLNHLHNNEESYSVSKEARMVIDYINMKGKNISRKDHKLIDKAVNLFGDIPYVISIIDAAENVAALFNYMIEKHKEKEMSAEDYKGKVYIDGVNEFIGKKNDPRRGTTTVTPRIDFEGFLNS